MRSRRGRRSGTRVDAIVEPMPDVKTTVTELPESRVRVEAEVPAEEVERRVQDPRRRLGRDLQMPGFRKGKVPPPVVIQRVGREAVLDEAVRGTLGRWYVEALDDAGIHPVGDPDVDLGDLPERGRAADVHLRDRRAADRAARRLQGRRGRPPRARGRRRGRRRRARAAARARGAARDRRGAPPARATSSSWTTSARSTASTFEGGEGRDQLVELGTGRLIPGFEEQLDGRQGRRRAHGQRDVPRRLRRGAPRRQGRASSP